MRIYRPDRRTARCSTPALRQSGPVAGSLSFFRSSCSLPSHRSMKWCLHHGTMRGCVRRGKPGGDTLSEKEMFLRCVSGGISLTASPVYPSALSGEEWAPLSPVHSRRKARRPASLGSDASHPQWSLVYAAHWLRLAVSARRVWSLAHRLLLPAALVPRRYLGNSSTPSCGSWCGSGTGGASVRPAPRDSQSVKTTEQGGPHGFDGL